MYFKKLEISGFKSFCDKTVLHFEPGITAVVGPNGCGKSNIFDSIRWVLGEQSAKSLRGSEMLDVIFNGTDNREPLGMAEVTLTFDNKARFFNLDNDEVAITRRLFRSGESEYLLNKSQVRLKDILDILLGTGIGAESYSIIAQGKIDLVLSSKPEERRQVFDEASGITKYKAQKREATRKLEETQQNLLRVNDIVTEVKRQIGSLERQANKARRYREVFDELRNKEISKAGIEKVELLTKKEKVINSLKDLKISEEALLASIRQEEERVASRSAKLKLLEEELMQAKNDLFSLENEVLRSTERISFNQEKIQELKISIEKLKEQSVNLEGKLKIEEEKLRNVREEYLGLKGNMENKSKELAAKDIDINELAAKIKSSLEKISSSKKEIIELVNSLAQVRNQISEFTSQQQVFLARKKRLELEKAKVYEEKVIAQDNLNRISEEVLQAKNTVEECLKEINASKISLESEGTALGTINYDIEGLERQKLTLQSHKEFLEELKAKYLDKAQSVNAVVYLDNMPKENSDGLVIKINSSSALSDEDRSYFGPANFKLSGEAKPIELDTEKIALKINKIEEELGTLRISKQVKESSIAQINKTMVSLEQRLRSNEINLANKETSRNTMLEQFNKIKEEEDIIVLDLVDVQKELSVLEANINSSNLQLADLANRQRNAEDSISMEEENISVNNRLREELLVSITQIKTELEALSRRLVSDENTLKLLEETYNSDKQSFSAIEDQIIDSSLKVKGLEEEINSCQLRKDELSNNIAIKQTELQRIQDGYKEFSFGAEDFTKKLEAEREELDGIKNRLYELQMEDKDIDYKYNSVKERMLQAYKIDLDTAMPLQEGVDISSLTQEIDELKKRLDSYGTVNLVAIEEYDELKKRYDFLVQQHTDLTNAKESLHQAILKINRTTRQMFMETFEKVREEFKNYFRLLFNGGDAQLYLIDEQDPLESGIEIICRPPGKKLQNVLLLSGGEKSMSAIALIFAIFKVKPSPFCVLDEIDAALDEANVDRFSRALQEFARGSQFIVITHNKKTIVNADVMYGITMQNSGVSKIVSVKFASDKQKDKDEAVSVV